MELCYPRFIHSEMLTHRDRARNSASSRAIPWKRFKGEAQSGSDPAEMIKKCMFRMIMDDPVTPLEFGTEQKGMVAGIKLEGEKAQEAMNIWLRARDAALLAADALSDLGVHKSLCNRLTEPFMWITVVMTSTDWKNFFALRTASDAEIHMQYIAKMMKYAFVCSEPQYLVPGTWHMPYIDPSEMTKYAATELRAISAGRCARVSYLTHDGLRDPMADIRLGARLVKDKHASPLEHVAEATNEPLLRSGPFRGWRQYRKTMPDDAVPE